ncbi:luciferin 4-monooxygenase-like [Rhynchophorus ferrugineus]|uniref:luciferin 4-monooxygenase-like n=1 Tax=Rhynchophorus ferrugineus TaxID=354439 RepID=UPI003FCC39AD
MEDLIVRSTQPENVYTNGFGEYFFEKAAEIGDSIFQIDGNTEEIETYDRVKTRTTRLAIGLRQLGLKPKDVVFICCYSGNDNIIPVLATLYLGGCVSSGDPRLTAEDTRYLIEQVEPKVIFVEQNSVLTIEKALKGSKLRPSIVVMGYHESYSCMSTLEAPHPEEVDFEPIKQTESDLAFILFSSGTTSVQKGVHVTNRYALNGGNIWMEANNLIPGVIMHFTSFFWGTAIMLTSACIVTGTARIVGKDITGERYLYLVDKYKMTYSFCSNTFTYQLTNLDEEVLKKYDTSSLVSFSVGGAVMQAAQIQRLRDILPHTKVTMTYGSTECNVICSFDISDDKAYRTKLVSSGQPVPGVEIKVVDLESGKLLGPHQEGEIRVRSSFAMSGYHKMESSEVFDEDGFIKVGDYGYYDGDKYIFVLGRIKSMFKYQYFQILPEAIEGILLLHPDVEEAVVFGVPHRVDNNHPGAVVVLKPNSDVTLEDLKSYCNSRLSNLHKLRAGLVILEKLPKTATGKIQRRIVRDNFIKMK